MSPDEHDDECTYIFNNGTGSKKTLLNCLKLYTIIVCNNQLSIYP